MQRFGRRRSRRIIQAAQDCIEVVNEVYQPLVDDETSAFKLDNLRSDLNQVLEAASARNRDVTRFWGNQAFYRYVLFQGRVIQGESGVLEPVDSLDEVLDLLNLINAL